MRITAFEVVSVKELGINADIKHIVSKSETCLVESYNSVLRYYLAL